MSGAARWVATYAYGVPYAYQYAIVWARDLAQAGRCAAALGLASGATSIGVALETDAHNIPALDPVAWQESCDRLAELRRQIRGEAEIDGHQEEARTQYPKRAKAHRSDSVARATRSSGAAR